MEPVPHAPFFVWCLTLALLVPASALADEAPGGHVTPGLPEYEVADPQAAKVTAANVLESERFWPFQVALRSAWTPPGGSHTLQPAFPGVLIRVLPGGWARVDFGRDGLFEIPLSQTDLLERADRIRLGRDPKQAPNFLYSVGTRLLDASREPLQDLPYAEADARDLFLLVFAEPNEAALAPIAAALAPMRDREGLLTIFFPEGRVPDAEVQRVLRALDWPVAFVYDHLAEPYAKTLRSADTPSPSVLLLSEEGRLIYEAAWDSEAVGQIASELAKSANRRSAAGGSPGFTPRTARVGD